MLILEVSSVDETHKHASLNDSCLPFKTDGSVLLLSTEISIISQGGKEGLQLKHHGYLATGGWVLIQTPTRGIDGMIRP